MQRRRPQPQGAGVGTTPIPYSAAPRLVLHATVVMGVVSDVDGT
jgi:hypothetical protein